MFCKKILTDDWWQYLKNMDKIAKNKNRLIKTVKSCGIWLLARIWLQKLPHSSISLSWVGQSDWPKWGGPVTCGRLSGTPHLGKCGQLWGYLDTSVGKCGHLHVDTPLASISPCQVGQSDWSVGHLTRDMWIVDTAVGRVNENSMWILGQIPSAQNSSPPSELTPHYRHIGHIRDMWTIPRWDLCRQCLLGMCMRKLLLSCWVKKLIILRKF